MLKPKFPTNEAERLQALKDLGLLDTPPEERFDRITRLAQKLFQVPIALVSLVDGDRQWFKSRQGLDATETPRDVSFCGHAILGDDVFYVPDAMRDPRFADNPLVTSEPKVRFYAGAPLRVGPDLPMGTLCVIDHHARELTPQQLELLNDLAAWANDLLVEGRRRKAAGGLAARGDFLDAVLNTVLEGIVTIDEAGTITSFNRAAETIFGYTAAEVLGTNVRTLMPEPYRGEHDGYLQRYHETGEARIIGVGREVEGLRKNGERFPMKLAVAQMSENQPRYFVGVIKDVSQHRLTERQLGESDRWRRAILDGASAAIIATAPNGVIRTFNRAAQQMLGYTEEEVIGRQTPLLFHDPAEIDSRARKLSSEMGCNLSPGFEALVARTRLGEVDACEWSYLRKDGVRIPVMMSITALRDHEGRIGGFLAMANDLSEQKKVERLKSEFVATVSHELRTPLTSIRGALGAVLGKASLDLPERVRKLLETANRNSERLTVLINDILDLEKIESGHMAFTMAPLDLVETCKAALAANAAYAQQYQVQFAPLDSSDEIALVSGDAHRLMQVMGNLLSNAVKYSQPGALVEVRLSRGREGYWRIGVRDHGTGIPEAFRANIFQRFAQADSSDTRAKGGTGLGLSIAKTIVEHHEGTIGYETELGVGTEFYFELPFLRVTDTAIDDARGGPKMLICEDNPDVAFVLAELVREHGIACDVVGTAADLRRQLVEGRYSGLLLDLKLPDASGLSVIKELRQSWDSSRLPILVVSGRADEGRQSWQGESLAVVDWLQKPVDRGRLEKALDGILRDAERPWILQVESDPDVVEITRSLVGSLGNFDHASSRAEARAKLNARHYDLAIIDARMPEGSGLELLTELPPGCKVLIYTEHELEDDVSAQVTAVLAKGKTSKDGLECAIRGLLGERSTDNE
jgi:PAS domain S-box-containing protein